MVIKNRRPIIGPVHAGLKMIHHFSIPAANPQRVATVLAELCQGNYAQFPPHPGSYIAFAGDEHGTAIEVYPAGTVLRPGQGADELQFAHQDPPQNFIATHAALSVALSETAIKEIGEREGWRAVRCDRDGLFEVIEFWLENTVLLELLTPEMASRYQEAVKPENIAPFLAD